MKLLLYCTKSKPNLYIPFEHDCFPEDETSKIYLASNPIFDGIDIKVNGKIVAECDCEKVELFDMEYHNDNSVLQTIHKIRPDYEELDEVWCERELICTNEDSQSISNCELLKNACLTFDQLGKYACKKGYGAFSALHLLNIKVFDTPKELKEYTQNGYMKILGTQVDGLSIKKAPQNMCYCYDKNNNKYMLLSIRPEYLCKIINGEKTIEVRKKVLNELEELIWKI